VLDGNGGDPGVRTTQLFQEWTSSNIVAYAVGALPDLLEVEPNNDKRRGPTITLPRVMNGRIDHPGDWDVFRFRAQAGNKIVAEVQARS